MVGVKCVFMGNIEKEHENQYHYFISFEYNDVKYPNKLFSTHLQLEKVHKSVQIEEAYSVAQSLLKLEKQLVPEGEIHQISLCDINGKPIVSFN